MDPFDPNNAVTAAVAALLAAFQNQRINNNNNSVGGIGGLLGPHPQQPQNVTNGQDLFFHQRQQWGSGTPPPQYSQQQPQQHPRPLLSLPPHLPYAYGGPGGVGVGAWLQYPWMQPSQTQAHQQLFQAQQQQDLQQLQFYGGHNWPAAPPPTPTLQQPQLPVSPIRAPALAPTTASVAPVPQASSTSNNNNNAMNNVNNPPVPLISLKSPSYRSNPMTPPQLRSTVPATVTPPNQFRPIGVTEQRIGNQQTSGFNGATAFAGRTPGSRQLRELFLASSSRRSSLAQEPTPSLRTSARDPLSPPPRDTRDSLAPQSPTSTKAFGSTAINSPPEAKVSKVTTTPPPPPTPALRLTPASFAEVSIIPPPDIYSDEATSVQARRSSKASGERSLGCPPPEMLLYSEENSLKLRRRNLANWEAVAESEDDQEGWQVSKSKSTPVPAPDNNKPRSIPTSPVNTEKLEENVGRKVSASAPEATAEISRREHRHASVRRNRRKYRTKTTTHADSDEDVVPSHRHRRPRQKQPKEGLPREKGTELPTRRPPNPKSKSHSTTPVALRGARRGLLHESYTDTRKFQKETEKTFTIRACNRLKENTIWIRDKDGVFETILPGKKDDNGSKDYIDSFGEQPFHRRREIRLKYRTCNCNGIDPEPFDSLPPCSQEQTMMMDELIELRMKVDAEREDLRQLRATLESQREEVREERVAVEAEREGSKSEREELTELSQLRATLESEREEVRLERVAVEAEREGLRSEREAVASEREEYQQAIRTNENYRKQLEMEMGTALLMSKAEMMEWYEEAMTKLEEKWKGFGDHVDKVCVAIHDEALPEVENKLQPLKRNQKKK